MRVGPPLTGPVDTLALSNGGRGAGGRAGAVAWWRRRWRRRARLAGAADAAGRGGRGGIGGAAARPTRRDVAAAAAAAVVDRRRRGGADETFPALPGRYIARLSMTPAEGAPTMLDQSFALTKDPMVIAERQRS